MFGLGPFELTILIFVLVLIFGPKKIPEIARSIGEAVRHIRKSFSGKTENNNKTNKPE